MGVSKDKVAYATFTGKAAEVLRRKGNDEAITLHKLLYDFRLKPTGGFYQIPKSSIDYNIVVIDEISMAPKSMIDLLLKHKVYCIFLGDPFQLPSLSKNDTHDLLDHPHVFLDEVMRQAKESEIIRTSMSIRNMEPLQYKRGEEVFIMPQRNFTEACYDWADQVLCATNKKRKFVNDKIREMRGYSGLPQDGERMICLSNYWHTFSSSKEALVNGTTGIIRNPQLGSNRIPRSIKTDVREVEYIKYDFITETDDKFFNIEADKKLLETGKESLDWETCYQIYKSNNVSNGIIPKQFDFGYCITAHKAQGSQYDKVLVLEESFPRDKTEHARWLYTACTRPISRLVLVRPYG